MRTNRPTKVPGFGGKLPPSTDKELAKRIDALTEAVDIRLGRRGDPQDRAITLRELIESGLAEELAATPFDPNNIRRGNIGLKPPTFSDTTVPPQPTGVSATGGYSLIQVYWDFPTYLNHSLTEIWRFDADTIGDAILVGTSGGRSFIDPVGQSKSYYYWVRHVSESGVPGPFHDTNGELATTATDVATLLSVLNGAITTSQLTSALLTRINLIDDSAAVVNSVSYRIAQEAAARTAAVDAAAANLQSQINDLVAVSPYDNATAYVTNDLVTYTGKLYRALSATTGNLPTNATYWELLGNYTSLAEAVAGNSSAIVELNNVSAGSGSANALALYALQSSVNHPTTGLSATRATLASEYYTKTATDAAIASATLSLASTTYVTSSINTALSSYTNTATLTANYYTKTAVDSAIAAATLSLASTSYVTSALAAYTPTATLAANYYTRTEADAAIAAAVLNLASTTYVTNSINTALSAYTNTATLNANYYTKTGADAAIAAAVLNLASTTYVTNSINSALSAYTTTASLTTNYYTKTATDSAIAAAVLNLVSTTTLNSTLSSYVTNATLTTDYYTRTATDSAISAATTTLVSTSTLNTALGNYTTTAALQASYYTKAQGLLLEAQYMVKIDINGRVSGFGLYSDNVGSAFTILADRFAIVSQLDNGMVQTPFVVQSTTTTVGGVTVPAGIYVDSAFIMNGTITNVKIANAAIDDAKIASLSANKITTGTLDTSRLNIDGASLIAEDGVLKVGALEADSIVANSITTSKLVGAAINAVTMSEIVTPNTLPTNATYETIDSVVVNKELEGDSYLTIDFEVDVTATGSGNYALYVRITKDGVVVSRTFSFFLTRSFAETVQGRVRLIGYGAGTSTYGLQVQANVSGAGISTATVNSSALTITEVKR